MKEAELIKFLINSVKVNYDLMKIQLCSIPSLPFFKSSDLGVH